VGALGKEKKGGMEKTHPIDMRGKKTGGKRKRARKNPTLGRITSEKMVHQKGKRGVRGWDWQKRVGGQ